MSCTSTSGSISKRPTRPALVAQEREEGRLEHGLGWKKVDGQMVMGHIPMDTYPVAHSNSAALLQHQEHWPGH